MNPWTWTVDQLTRHITLRRWREDTNGIGRTALGRF